MCVCAFKFVGWLLWLHSIFMALTPVGSFLCRSSIVGYRFVLLLYICDVFGFDNVDERDIKSSLWWPPSLFCFYKRMFNWVNERANFNCAFELNGKIIENENWIFFTQTQKIEYKRKLPFLLRFVPFTNHDECRFLIRCHSIETLLWVAMPSLKRSHETLYVQFVGWKIKRRRSKIVNIKTTDQKLSSQKLFHRRKQFSTISKENLLEIFDRNKERKGIFTPINLNNCFVWDAKNRWPNWIDIEWAKWWENINEIYDFQWGEAVFFLSLLLLLSIHTLKLIILSCPSRRLIGFIQSHFLSFQFQVGRSFVAFFMTLTLVFHSFLIESLCLRLSVSHFILSGRAIEFFKQSTFCPFELIFLQFSSAICFRWSSAQIARCHWTEEMKNFIRFYHFFLPSSIFIFSFDFF